MTLLIVHTLSLTGLVRAPSGMRRGIPPKPLNQLLLYSHIDTLSKRRRTRRVVNLLVVVERARPSRFRIENY